MVLPMGVAVQERLLTLNVKQEKPIEFGDFMPGIKLWPLFLDPDNGVWVMYAEYSHGVRLPKHIHTGSVHFFTVKGTWGYVEHPEDMQTPGSYLYEPANSVHTFQIPEGGETVEGFMVINGVNVTFDENDNYITTEGSGSLEQIILQAAKAQGIPMPRYIRPSGKVDFTR